MAGAVMTYTDPKTGLTFISQDFMNTIAGQQVIAQYYAEHGVTAATAGLSNQIGSQGTVVTNPDGTWSLTNGQNSDAQTAYDDVVLELKRLQSINPNALSPAMAAVANGTASPASLLNPGNTQSTQQSGSGSTVSTPSSSPGSDSNPTTGTGLSDAAGSALDAATSNNTQDATPGDASTGSNPLTAITGAIGTYGIYLLAGVIAIIFVFLLATSRGSTSRSPAGVES